LEIKTNSQVAELVTHIQRRVCTAQPQKESCMVV
jgi:hypothetical protein